MPLERKIGALKPAYLLGAFVAGVLVCWWEKTSPPPENPGLYSLVTVGGCVAFLMLGGGYVLRKGRDEDREHYRSMGTDTEETRLRLERRHKQLGTLSWSMTAGGIAAAVIIVGKLLIYQFG